MTFNRTLSQLADEYFEQAQVLDGIIARHRKRLSALPNPETSDEAYKIKTLLNVLYKAVSYTHLDVYKRQLC